MIPRLFTLSALLCLFVETGWAWQRVSWDRDEGGNGHYYQIVPLSGNWTDADAFADGLTFNGMPGHLVTITSESERDFIQSFLLPSEEPITFAGDHHC